jgi:hypothetical protein
MGGRGQRKRDSMRRNIPILLRHVLLDLFVCHSITYSSIYLIKGTPLDLSK